MWNFWKKHRMITHCIYVGKHIDLCNRLSMQYCSSFKLRIGDTDHCFDFSFVHWFKESRRWNRKQWKQWYDHPKSKAQPSRFLFEKLEDLRTPQYVNIYFFFPSEHNGIRWKQYKTFYCVRFLHQFFFFFLNSSLYQMNECSYVMNE